MFLARILTPRHHTPACGRLVWLDHMRGLALVAMVVFHGFWDLGFVGFLDPATTHAPGVKLVGHAIAASFLLVVGLSLHLAPRWRWSRMGVLALAAAAVSGGTYLVDPATYVVFGILHCICVATCLAQPLVRKPPMWAWMCALLAFAAPWLPWPAVFNAPGLIWLGLGTAVPATVDWQPLFPWCGFVFAGLAAGKTWQSTKWFETKTTTRPSRFSTLLSRAGQNSLLIYLGHQPVLLALLMGLAAVLPLQKVSDETAFLQACEAQCGFRSPGHICERVCQCVVTSAKDNQIWRSVLQNTLSPAQSEAFNTMARTCVERTF